MAFHPHVLPEELGPGKKEQIQGVPPLWTALMTVVGGVGNRKRVRDGSWLGDGWPHGVLTVAWLQSVGMCGRVAGVAGAAREAVVVLLLAVTDAVHAVSLDRGELHALNVHLCTQKENMPGYFCFQNRSKEGKLFISNQLWACLLGSLLNLWIKPRFRQPLTLGKQADLCAPTANPHPLINNCMCVYLTQD